MLDYICIDKGVYKLYTTRMDKDLLFIHGKFQSLMQLAKSFDRAPRRFGTDDLLPHSEIHLIEIIGDNKGLSVTEIAGCLNITKGAVSQTLKKLESKGYTIKKPHPENLSRAVVSLTAKGQTAFWAHKDWHEQMDGGFARYLKELDKDDLRIIAEFLEKIETFLTRRLESIK